VSARPVAGVFHINAAPATPQGQPEASDRWMTIQLVGEIVGTSFERGISQYPNVRDEVHLVLTPTEN
jgi:hypothetical protein